MKLIIMLATLLMGLPCAADSLKLSSTNSMVIRGFISSESMMQAQMQLAELVEKRAYAKYTIYIVFDSPGGSIIDGESFIQYAKTIRDVHTISIFAASMASAIVEALPGKRYITENGIMMFHRARGNFQGQFEAGEVESQLAFFKGVVLQMETRNANRLKLPIAVYKEKVKDEYWVSNTDAVKQNVVDAAADIVCTSELIKSKVATVQATPFGIYEIIWSGCPLFRSPLLARDGEEE